MTTTTTTPQKATIMEAPRVVTPTRGTGSTGTDRKDVPAVSPMLHKPTATTGGGITYDYEATGLQEINGNDASTTTSSLRYSLNAGRAAPRPSTATAAAISPKKKKMTVRKVDPNAYKIFILLLQPKSKIFELIQLIYSPHDTTVGDILALIPSNATEPALGQEQTYKGLCRPKTQEELLDLDVLASDVNRLPGISSTTASSIATTATAITAKITLGEILVAIPDGYTGSHVATLSKQILANPKIVKLLQRADPLAPKRKHRSSSRRSKSASGSSTRRHSSRNGHSKDAVEVLERHDEEAEEEDTHRKATTSNNNSSGSKHKHKPHRNIKIEEPRTVEEKLEYERRMKSAMEHALAEAAAANAAIPGKGGGAMIQSSLFTSTDDQANRTNEDASLEGEYSRQESLDESFSSWSKSFDASFSAQNSICSGVSKRANRRKERQIRRWTLIQRFGAATFGLMMVFYLMDPHKDRTVQKHEETIETPMGLLGIFQCAFLLLVLYKVERLVRTTMAAHKYHDKTGIMPTIYMSEENRSCPFLKAAGRAYKRIQRKYQRRLQKQSQSQLQQQQQSTTQKTSTNDQSKSLQIPYTPKRSASIRKFQLRTTPSAS